MKVYEIVEVAYWKSGSGFSHSEAIESGVIEANGSNVKELKERFIDERIEIEYTLQGDCYILNITIPKTRRTGNIGKYGRLKLNYMQMQTC